MRAALVLMAGLLTSCGHGTSPPSLPEGGVPAGPDGAWLVTFAGPDLGEVLVPMRFTISSGGRFEASSRPGALVHIADGDFRARGDTLELRGILLSGVMGEHPFTGTLAGGEITGELRSGRSGTEVTVNAVRASHEGPVRDYGAIARDIADLTRRHLYDPRVLRAPEWRAFFRVLERRLPGAHDDAEALTIFHLAARSLGVSHYALVGSRYAEIRDRLREADLSAQPTPVRLGFPEPAVAHLVVDHFMVTPELIRETFSRIEAAKAHSLILDLRGVPGGNLSSMTVASHLLDRATPAGVFVGPAWWKERTALPGPSDDLLIISEVDLEAFFRNLREHGALLGRVLPRDPHFAGRVYVLTDRRTGSAAEPLADLLQTTGRGVLVGERTAGAMLSSERFPLPEGLVLIIPTADYFSAQGRRLEGEGVSPDVEVPSSEALDVALRLSRR